MTKRDVIKALEKAREEHADEKAADEEIIRKKDERINKLSRRSTRSTMREKSGELLNDSRRFATDIASFLRQTVETADAIEALYDEAGVPVDAEVKDALQKDVDLICEWQRTFNDRFGM
jgi:hypothetical protein